MAIEFSRNITFGQYLSLASPIHRLDPRTKIAATALLMLALLLVRSFAGLAVALVTAALIQTISRVPLGYTLRGMRLLINTMLFIFAFQVLFFAGPAEPWWRWGVLSISPEGVQQGLLTLGRVVLLYHLVTTLMFTTPLMDLADGAERLLSPLKWIGVPVSELALTVVIALKFVPLLVAELERLIKAQAARGERFDKGGFVERGRKLGTLLVPLFINAFARAEVLTTAMNARCYRGGDGRTKFRVLRPTRADLLALAAAAALAAATIYAGRVILPIITSV